MLALGLLHRMPSLGAILASCGPKQANGNVNTLLYPRTLLVWEWAAQFRFWSYMVEHEWEP